MSIKNHSFRILQLKNKRKITGVLDKISVKSIVLPEVYEKDDSTINFVKRIGGQVLQAYSMRNLDIAIEDNFTYYYLISEMYPYTQDSENVNIALTDFTIDLYQTKQTYPLLEEYISATGVTNMSVTSKVVIKYSNYLVKDVAASKGVSFFDMIHKHVINYSTYMLDKEIMVSTGNKYFSFTSQLFPIINKSHIETVFTTLENFEIEVI